MTIKSDLSQKFIKIYSESRGFAKHKNKILKKGKIPKLNLIEEILIYSSILFIIGIYIVINPRYLYIYGYLILFIDILYLFSNIIRIYEGYKFRKRKNFISEIEINEKGITDYSSFDGMELIFKWNIIDSIVLGKHSVTIFTKGRVYFYFDIKDEEKIIKTVKKYKPDIKIIE